MPNEGCSRYQRSRQRRIETKLHARRSHGAIETHHVLLKSIATERQLFDVLARPYFLTMIGEDTRFWLHGLMAAAMLIEIADRIAACRDPTDDKFLELAVNGGAEVIVSGDADLLALDPFRGIPVLTPAAFIEQTRP